MCIIAAMAWSDCIPGAILCVQYRSVRQIHPAQGWLPIPESRCTSFFYLYLRLMILITSETESSPRGLHKTSVDKHWRFAECLMANGAMVGMIVDEDYSGRYHF